MPTSFGQTPDGRPVRLFTLDNGRGLRAELSDLGATIVSLFAPDRTGRAGDVVLGFGDAAAYAAHTSYFGCVIGRVGNRIAGGRFTLDGREYRLATNNAPAGLPCCLHGGRIGFDRAVWRAEPADTPAGPAVRFFHRSPAGDEGFPGRLDVVATYTATTDNALRLDYEATCDAPTPVALTNHVYFNLAGEGSGDVLGHQARFHASRFTPVDAGLIPLGHLAPVAGTPLDFTRARAIGDRISDEHEQLRFGLGYDHNLVIDHPAWPPSEPTLAAEVFDPSTGRVLETLTTEPGMQFYTGNFLDGSLIGKSGRAYGHRHGFCLETQHFPDSVNQPAFPTTILRPGRTLRSTTIYRFSAR
jgi:aldose 1-epimerase